MSAPTKKNSSDHEAWNDQMARQYNPDSFITKSGAIIRWVEGCRLTKTRKILATDSSHAVLDLGCGPGNLLATLEGREVVGVDLSDAMLAFAQERVKNRPHIKVLKANAERLEFPDNYFDRVVCSEVLEHVQDPAVVIAEMLRVAKNGARVVVTVPNETLINFSKRIVLLLGLKKIIAGQYDMSDDMLDAWHVREVEKKWILETFKKGCSPAGSWCSPSSLLPYHRILAFTVQK